jgi:hypothetical protein
MFSNRLWQSGTLAATILLTCGASAAWAEISFVTLFRTEGFTQTADGGPVASNGFFVATDLFSTVANEFDSVEMVYPGPASPQALSQFSPTDFHFQTGSIATQAEMDAAFPTGTYTHNASGPGGSDSTSFDYTTDDFPQSQPFLAGTNYSDLQGMNAALPFDFDFSPYVTGMQATESILFFTIFDVAASSLVFDGGFMPATTTGLTLPAGTLEPGKSYIYELIFSNRDSVPSPGAAFNALLGFDLRTTGTFTTLVPEPASLAFALQAGAALASIALWRAARRHSVR